MSARHHSLTILVAEDEKLLRTNIAFALSNQRTHAVKAVGSGEEALELLDKDEFDLVITDIKMGEVSGVELLSYVSENHPETGVIVMTAFGSEAQRYEILGRGGLKYLEKPFSLDLLIQTVDEVGAKQRRSGFKTTIDEITLVDLIQLHCLNQATGCIRTQTKGYSGEIYITRGKLVHAAAGHLTGDAALLEMLEWEGGSCHFHRNVEAKEQSIPELSADQVLLDCLRILDEKNKDSFLGGRAAETEEEELYLNPTEVDLALARLDTENKEKEDVDEGEHVTLAVELAEKASTHPSVTEAFVLSLRGRMLAQKEGGSDLDREGLRRVVIAVLELSERLKTGVPDILEVSEEHQKLMLLRLKIGFLGLRTSLEMESDDVIAWMQKPKQ